MFQVCEEQNCEDQVFPLSVNFLDRFLCACDISKTHLQLTGAVCLLLASKVRQCTALTIELLCYYTENSVTPEEMRVSLSEIIRKGFDIYIYIHVHIQTYILGIFIVI